jgi:hypothetical protein
MSAFHKAKDGLRDAHDGNGNGHAAVNRVFGDGAGEGDRRNRAITEAEAAVDEVIFALRDLGGLEPAVEALREARRVLIRATSE